MFRCTDWVVSSEKRPSPPRIAFTRGFMRRVIRPRGRTVSTDCDHRTQIALVSLDICLVWGPEVFHPPELARIASVASSLRVNVAQACAHQLRRVKFLLLVPGGSARLAPGERALHRAQRQSLASRVQSVAAENYSAVIGRRGKLVIWGRPGWMEFRTACSSSRDCKLLWPLLRPIEAMPACAIASSGNAQSDVLPQIASLAASRHAVFALTVSGEVMYVQVRRDASHQTVEAIELRHLQELLGVRVVQLATRFGQAYATTSDGSVYAWGMKTGNPNRPEFSCSMGFGEVATRLHPELLPNFGPGIGCTPIRFVSAGVSHALFVSIFGEVYSVGRTEHGKLGLGRDNQEHVLSPRKIRFGSQCSTALITAACAGWKHSLFLASNGEVWGCGLARDGALPMKRHGGHGRLDRWEPVLLDRLQCFCTGVATGTTSSYFVGDCGEVWFSGTARQTKTPFGRPLHANPALPYRIPGLRQVEQVSVSMELSFGQWEHVLFYRQDGSIHAWGHVGHGEFQPTEKSSPMAVPRALRNTAVNASPERRPCLLHSGNFGNDLFTSDDSLLGKSSLLPTKFVDEFCNHVVPISSS
eukprot:TRINITY_DN25884_c0_g1_i1.p1 TRINITY_DN25884_c0_g1~~TRINITY_DN25884_c0_g1_i1.p1  ORF type:complete len:585 (+),score=51.08 TRINITY_DN25884_c0_g1_i1:255-2009(+)